MIKNLQIWTIGSLFEQVSKALVFFTVLSLYSIEDTHFYSLYLLFISLNVITQFGIIDRLYLQLPKLCKKPKTYEFYFQKQVIMLATLQWVIQLPLISIFSYLYGVKFLEAFCIFATCNIIQYLNLTVTKIRYRNELPKAVKIRIQIAMTKIIVVLLAFAHAPIIFIVALEGLISLIFLLKNTSFHFVTIKNLSLNTVLKFLKRNKFLIALMLCLVMSTTAERNLVAYLFDENYLVLLTTIGIFISPIIFFLNQFLSILAQEYRKNVRSSLNLKKYFGDNILRGQVFSIVILSIAFIYFTLARWTSVTDGFTLHDEIFIAIFILISKIIEGLIVASYYNQKMFRRVILAHVMCFLCTLFWYFSASKVFEYEIVYIILIGSALRIFLITFIDIKFIKFLTVLSLGYVIYYLAFIHLTSASLELFLLIYQISIFLFNLRRKSKYGIE